ncbi:protein phosphatase 1L [Diabrotica undecimpunctata]|uniref:protein phosphatase 1L n=1 Tax=Diabrotica undecimpunctata TaxID=50387 RepID=UPI003B63D2C6
MEDELDDKIFYQTYVSHMKIMSRVSWTVPLKLSHITFSSHIWRQLKIYIFKPEFLIFGVMIFFIFIYIQAVDEWSRTLLGKFQYSIGKATSKSKIEKLSFFSNANIEKSSWEMKVGTIAAYALQGRRPKMEDRFVINDNISNTGVALFAVFDGHGGEFAATYAKEKLMQNLFNKVIEIKGIISGDSTKSVVSEEEKEEKKDPEKPVTPTIAQRRKSFRRTNSTTDECIEGNKEITDLQLLSKLDSIKPISKSSKPLKTTPSFKKVPVNNYFDKYGIVNYEKLLTDEVLAADERLLEIAKKSLDVAGTTALIAILEGNRLIVANVGDSRGVMCDSKGNAIPLSFDHKPQQMRERKRIKAAGGFVSFNGVWRVAGILATSRALGDYPLKDKKLVIAEPDILTFDLHDHKPLFLILATDGLWDTFSNEEAVSFIKERLSEPDYGAKSLALQSYYRGSTDNITVIIINFKDYAFSKFTASAS